MKRLLPLGAIVGALMLSGCATSNLQNIPNEIQNTMQDTQDVATGAVGIVADLIKIGFALVGPVTSIIAIIPTL